MTWAAVTSSTLSMMDPRRPTMRPLRTFNTWTETSRSSPFRGDQVEVLGAVGHHLLASPPPGERRGCDPLMRAARS